MTHHSWTIGVTFFLISFMGCQRESGDWQHLRQVAKGLWPETFDNDKIIVTRFAIIGKLIIEGDAFHVVDVDAVLSGMLAPRGQNYLLLMAADERVHLCFHWQSDWGKPLWCSGSRLYLHGNASPSFPPSPELSRILVNSDEIPSGNVIDWANGLNNPVLTREKAYGSSGGIEDTR